MQWSGLGKDLYIYTIFTGLGISQFYRPHRYLQTSQLNLTLEGLFKNGFRLCILRFYSYRMFLLHIVPILLVNNNRTLYFVQTQGSYSSYGHRFPSSSCICLLLLSLMSSSLNKVFPTLSH